MNSECTSAEVQFSNKRTIINIPLNERFRYEQASSLRSKIRRIVRSVAFEVCNSSWSLKLLGPDMSYHNVDPDLQHILDQQYVGLDIKDILHFKQSKKHFDLCFEDSWTGYFMALWWQNLAVNRDLILIHLDDHTDMMPTLLERCAEHLYDPTTNMLFDPLLPSSWEKSIVSGAIYIGSFITPFYYIQDQFHVRHLNNFKNSTHKCYEVTRHELKFSLIPSKKFAGIRKHASKISNSDGTYLGGPDASKVLSYLPEGDIIVHIDLDYLINDFNGNEGQSSSISADRLMTTANKKLDVFFQQLRAQAIKVEKWIVGTSPGFCSSLHWQLLCNEIEKRIVSYHG